LEWKSHGGKSEMGVRKIEQYRKFLEKKSSKSEKNWQSRLFANFGGYLTEKESKMRELGWKMYGQGYPWLEYEIRRYEKNALPKKNLSVSMCKMIV
jgi:hypothetical protein